MHSNIRLCIIQHFLKFSGLSCGNPGRPEDGRRFGSNFTVGANVSYSCNGGYTLVGSAIRTCQSDGLWSGELVICVDKSKLCTMLNS